jgi:succinoglycan biosynthesis transport protein ExoP
VRLDRKMLLRPSEQLNVEPAQSGTAGVLIDHCLGFLRRQFWILLVCLAVVLPLGGLYLWITPATYSASATMLLEARKGGIQQKSVLGDAPGDTGWIDSQIGILALERDKIGQAVAKKLQLSKDRSFLGLDSQSNGLIDQLINLFWGGNDGPGPEAREKSESELMQEATGVVASGLDVKRVGFTYLIAINYSSPDPHQAVRIANAAADEYVLLEMDARFQAIRQASDWLQERYQALREQALTADRAVVEYKADNNIITAGGKLINDQQLTEINARLSGARARKAEAESRLTQIESVLKLQETSGTVDATVSDALANPIITKLRSQYLDLINREADWSTRFGRNHLAVVNLRNQARDIRTSIHEELRRIAETYRSDLEVAKNNQIGAEKELEKIVAQVPNEAQIRLRELEGSASSYRNFYDNFHQSYTAAVQEQSSPISETRVISHATGAYKSNPSTGRIIAMTLLGAIGLGIGLGVLREAMDRVFRTTEQVQLALQTECIAFLPRIKIGSRSLTLTKDFAQTNKKQDLIETVKPKKIIRASDALRLISDAPFSRFAEALRGIKLAADLERGTTRPKNVIGITSSLPREGKSTVAAAFACLLAHVGARTLLVDCDLRNPALSRLLAPNAACGILEVIRGIESLDQALWTDPESGLEFLPTTNVSKLAHTDQILASQAMSKCFDILRTRYDYVIVDLSPIAPVVDVRATTGLVDFYVFVVEWGTTKVDVVQHALKEARGVYENILGVVLNKVNMNSVARYDRRISKYYYNREFAQYGYND